MSEGTTVASVSVGPETLQKALSGEFTKVCQVLVLHITEINGNATTNALRYDTFTLAANKPIKYEML